MEHGFPWNLHGGDEVFWNDPDDGACSRRLKVLEIEYHGELGDPECIVRITAEDGSFIECFASELS